MIWTLKDTGRPAPGVYAWDGKSLIGVWGYAEEVTIEEDGRLKGEGLRPDRIYKLEAVVPEIDID